MDNIETFRICKNYNSIYYIPNFVTEEEEKYITDQVYKAPIPRWTQLSNRRLQNWGGLPHPKGMIAEAIPTWLNQYMERISVLGVFEDKSPNHVLINEYLPNQGIMAHLDGPLFYPTISTISLGSHTVINFFKPVEDSELGITTPEADRLELSLYIEPRSLLILKETMYEYYMHGIAENSEDIVNDKIINSPLCGLVIGEKKVRDTRISLTIRHVPKTTKTLLKLIGK